MHNFAVDACFAVVGLESDTPVSVHTGFRNLGADDPEEEERERLARLGGQSAQDGSAGKQQPRVKPAREYKHGFRYKGPNNPRDLLLQSQPSQWDFLGEGMPFKWDTETG